MKWFADFFGKKNKPDSPIVVEAIDPEWWSDELFTLCWEREALFVEIDTAKRHKKKSSHLIAALAKNTARRLEIELAHNGKRA